MSRIISQLRRRAAKGCATPCVVGPRGLLGPAQLVDEMDRLGDHLHGRCLGLLMDNGPAWAVADLAALDKAITCVPLPGFFSNAQLKHAIADAGIDTILTDDPGRARALCGLHPDTVLRVAGEALSLFRPTRAADAPDLGGIAKVTYTSGTTGAPKGVCLSAATLDTVAASLCEASQASERDASLSLLPLPVLLENIGGLYAPLLADAHCHLLPQSQIGLQGSGGVDPAALLATLLRLRPSTLILIPQLLQALVEAAEAGYPPPDSLRYVAVGGAHVAPSLRERAQAQGIPVYQGYGLSEAGSVVTVNRPNDNRPGSVGKPLRHVRLRVADDGEILVGGSLFRGYLGDRPLGSQAWWHSGDLGRLDQDGFLYLTGRRKNLFITAYGRNVAPEWVESELLLDPAIAQVAVFGEARPFNVAVIVARPGIRAERVGQALEQANRQLPDYARIGRYVLGCEPFSVENGQLTGTGRPRRAQIGTYYRDAIEALYEHVA